MSKPLSPTLPAVLVPYCPNDKVGKPLKQLVLLPTDPKQFQTRLKELYLELFAHTASASHLVVEVYGEEDSQPCDARAYRDDCQLLVTFVDLPARDQTQERSKL